ncbi:MAG: PIN domain-containing protein [Actinobacteria bacterium]|nr:PIN domain-containing protein [Actinomycetota bacterium]
MSGQSPAGVGVTLDAGALIALDKGNGAVRQLILRVARTGEPVVIPATALAQAVRSPERQARLALLLRRVTTEVRPLDRRDAVAVGRLLRESGTSDVVDAHVVVCARRAGQAVLTSDPGDLRRLDPELVLVAV